MQKGASFAFYNTLVKYTHLFHDNNVAHVYRWGKWVTWVLSSPWYWAPGPEFEPNALAQVHLQTALPLCYLHMLVLSCRKSSCLCFIPIHHFLPIWKPEFGRCSMMSWYMSLFTPFRFPSVILHLAYWMVRTRMEPMWSGEWGHPAASETPVCKLLVFYRARKRAYASSRTRQQKAYLMLSAWWGQIK